MGYNANSYTYLKVLLVFLFILGYLKQVQSYENSALQITIVDGNRL